MFFSFKVNGVVFLLPVFSDSKYSFIKTIELWYEWKHFECGIQCLSEDDC